MTPGRVPRPVHTLVLAERLVRQLDRGRLVRVELRRHVGDLDLDAWYGATTVVSGTTNVGPLDDPASSISCGSGFSIVTLVDTRAPTAQAKGASVRGGAGVASRFSWYQNSPTRSFRKATDPRCVFEMSGAYMSS